jgi:hypothetical protein
MKVPLVGEVPFGEPCEITTTVDCFFQPTHAYIEGPGELLDVIVAGKRQRGSGTYGRFSSMNRPGIKLGSCVEAQPGESVGLLVKMQMSGALMIELSEDVRDTNPLESEAERAIRFHAR